MVKVILVGPEGYALDEFNVTSGNVREELTSNPQVVANQLREHISMRFEIEDEE